MATIDIPESYQIIKTKLESIVSKKHYTKTEIDDKLSNRITSIELLDKTEDSTGAIKLYYGDEPTD